jgi:dTDP-4-dehydrorhamnose 3,5-epimerase
VPIEVKPAEFPGVLLLRPQEFSDDRGQFCETYNAATFEQWLGPNVSFVQDNQTRSRRGVLRGLHYQTERVQGKLLRVLNGTIFDVVVDLRRSSPTFGRWHGVEMSASERWQIWIPPGLAHGFLTLSNNAEILYKVTDYWHPTSERTLQWNDPYLRVEWPLSATAHPPIVSVKDAAGLAWEEAPKFD